MSLLDKAHKDGVVVGLKEVAGVAPRLDIDVLLLTKPKVFNLLLIALMELKGDPVTWAIDDDFKVPRSDKMSYFKLAGIHGLPRAPWDGEVGLEEKPTKPIDGYCAHGVPYFGPWHRPYLALLEQTLFRQIKNVAERFSRSQNISQSEKKDYINAAKEFRLPYWDYYRPRDVSVWIAGVFPDKDFKTQTPYDFHMPKIFTEPIVMVKTLPDNDLKPMDNPFYEFKFQEKDLSDEEWGKSDLSKKRAFLEQAKKRTLRHSGDSSSVHRMNAGLNKIREDAMRKVLQMIEKGVYSNYYVFSTQGAPDPNSDPDRDRELFGKPLGNIEALHGNYHVYVGGFIGPREKIEHLIGHMSCVPVSAFDPVFWMHHAQIDRLFAIWQSANREHWFEELPTKELKDQAELPLLPFRKYPLVSDLKERYWNPNRSRNTEDFGYTYLDLKESEEETRKAFAKNYGWSRRLTPFEPFGEPPEEMKPLDLSGAQVYQYTSGTPVLNPPIPLTTTAITQDPEVLQMEATDETMSYEWYVDTIVERMALNGSFTIFYIVGDVTGESASEWAQLPGFAGAFHVFTASVEMCDNCGRQQDQAQLVANTTPITSLLLDYVKAGRRLVIARDSPQYLESMRPEHVQPFLEKNLKWRISNAHGPVNPRELAERNRFKLSVSSKTAPLPGQTGDPNYELYGNVIDDIISSAS